MAMARSGSYTWIVDVLEYMIALLGELLSTNFQDRDSKQPASSFHPQIRN